MRKILVTGGCGFVGSNLCLKLKQKYPTYELIAFDNLKRRGSELNIGRLKSKGVTFMHGDIRNIEDFEGLSNVDTIIDASAEPSVLAGLNGTPNYLIHTNFNGTINCLNLALKNKADFIFISTSRVYPINKLEQINYKEVATRFEIEESQIISGISSEGLTEEFPIEGYRSLYGATKLASELVIAEYQKLLGLKTVINRCGVITGPFQMGKVDQGVVVLWVAKHFWKKPLAYLGFGGTGKQVRDILHVDDLFRLIDYQIHNIEKVNGQTMNVGGGKDTSISLLELTRLCQEVVGNKISIGAVSETRQADIPLYITNNLKVTEMTGWKPQKRAKDIVADIFSWLQDNEARLKPILM